MKRARRPRAWRPKQDMIGVPGAKDFVWTKVAVSASTGAFSLQYSKSQHALQVWNERGIGLLHWNKIFENILTLKNVKFRNLSVNRRKLDYS
jgi:hypothetical protein